MLETGQANKYSLITPQKRLAKQLIIVVSGAVGLLCVLHSESSEKVMRGATHRQTCLDSARDLYNYNSKSHLSVIAYQRL